MRKSNYYKSIFRDMKNTKGKIFSIFVMIMLASMVVVGLFLTGPTMRKTLNKTLNKAKHPDIIVKSTYGLNDEDRLIIEKDEDIDKVSYQKVLDLYDGKTLLEVLSKDKTFPKYNIKEGSDIKNDDEIVVDEALKDKYKIGDCIEFKDSYNEKIDSKLKNKKYKIVGFANSTENLMNDIRDYSLAGKKMVDGFAFIAYENYKNNKLDIANIYYKKINRRLRFDETYLSFVDKKKEDLEYDFKYRPKKVLNEIKDKENKKLDEREIDLKDAKDKLNKEEKKIYEQNSKLIEALDTYKNAKNDFYKEIAKADNLLLISKREIDKGFDKLARGKIDYENAKNKFNDESSKAYEKLSKSKDEIDRAYGNINKANAEITNSKNNIENSFISNRDKLANLKNSINEIGYEINKLNEQIKTFEINIENLEKELEKLEDIEENQEKIKQIESNIQLNEQSLSKDKSERDKLIKDYNLLKETYDMEKKQYDEAYEIAMNPILEKEKEISKSKVDLDEKNKIYELSKIKFEKENENAKISLEKSKNDLIMNEKKLNKALEDYKLGFSSLNEKKTKGRKNLDDSYNKLLAKQRQLEEFNEKFFKEKNKSLAKINEGFDEINKVRKSLAKLVEGEYDIANILSNKSINTYYKNSLNMDELSKVFPTFFYFIALLVSLTTIRRYIEEQRIQNGTLKSLGYRNKDIANKFYIYALIPTVLGSIIGVFLGKYLISKVIFMAYSSGFDLLKMDFENNLYLLIGTIVLSIMLIASTVFLTSRSEVNEQTADLLRSKPPKGGSRIFLEKINYIWSRLSFMTKITFRNIFRYKSRMLMTIFGIGGCTALLFFGFAMTDSIKDTSYIQRNELTKYEYINIFDTKASKDDLDKYEDILKDVDYKRIYYKKVKIKGKKKIDATLLVFKDKFKLNDFINIRRDSKNPLKLSDYGIIVTLNLYNNLLNKDELILDDKKIKINNVAENYIDDYIYMSKENYEEIFSKKLKYNADIIKENDEKLKDKILMNDISLSLIQPNKSYETIDTLMVNLNLVIVIISLVSMILAIVVLYNLTNINVSERKKELATTKVLGFYPRETTAYIYRETYILTILGVILGFILGYLMLRYVLAVVSPDGVYLSIKTHISSYLFSSFMTLFISFIIMIIVHFRLKKINMAEAMKAGE